MSDDPRDDHGSSATNGSSANNSSSADNVSADLTGRELGDYRLLRRLGAGGMAEVYLAEQQSLSRQVALKVLNQSLASDASYVERFKNEARAAASLVHPNIVQIFEVGQTDGVHFIAQEYVAGKNLGQLLDREGAFQPALVLDILRQVVAALCKAHELQIVHRDIKPENLLLSNSGEVKVADFGLARVQNTDTKTLTQVGVTMGTPLYMSPEQVEGRQVDARSDIYSLGIACYHLLAGVPPHTGETALAIAVQHLHKNPEPLENVRSDVPSALARIVHKMIAKKPESRPTAPSELLVELRELASGAAQDGWATGPEDWSLTEWIATEPARSRQSEQLDKFMKAETQLQPRERNRHRLAIALVAATIFGVALGAISRPRFYLARARQSVDDVPDQGSPWGQLYYAQTSGTEAAWQRAVDYPDDDPFVKQIARRGMLRHWLVIEQDWDATVPRLRRLEQESRAEEPPSLLRAFSLAGLSICYQKLDNPTEAIATRDKLTREMLELLRDKEPQLVRLYESSMRQLEAS